MIRGFVWILPVLLLSFALPSESFAMGGTPPSANFRSAEIGGLPQGVKLASPATEMLISDSFSFVSNDGYMLTSLASASMCLGAFEKLDVITSQSKGWAYWASTSQVIDDTIHCQFGGFYVGASVRIVFVGKGLPFLWKEFAGISDADLAKFRDAGAMDNDYAILKLDSRYQRDCNPINAADPLVPGKKIWSLGYPFEGRIANFSKKTESTGTERGVLAYSEGTVISGLKESAYAKDPANQAYIAMLEKVLAGTSSVVTDLDFSRGSYGSPVVNEKGEIIGIVSGAVDPYYDHMNRMKYIAGSTLVIPVSKIVADVKAQMGDEAVAKIFNCKR